jgi:ferric-dicitrate binding protein FerR (iron transport regulator)
MSSEYLFEPQLHAPDLDDNQGHDSAVLQLEQLCSSLRWNGELPPLPLEEAREPQASHKWRRGVSLLTAASILVMGLLWMAGAITGSDLSPYRLQDSAGLVSGKQPLLAGEPLHYDTVLIVKPELQSTLEIGEVGHLVLDGGSRLKILRPLDQFGDGRLRLRLYEGAAEVWLTAPSRAFLVETPWFQVWDLGCHYRLEVDAQGFGSLTVVNGAVQFVSDSQNLRLAAGQSLLIEAGKASRK